MDETISFLNAKKELLSKTEDEWAEEGREYLRSTGLFSDEEINHAYLKAYLCAEDIDAESKRYLVVSGLSCGETGKLIDRSRNSVQGSCRLGTIKNYWFADYERIIPLEEVVRLREKYLAKRKA